MVPPFATAHTFCASWDVLRKLDFLVVPRETFLYALKVHVHVLFQAEQILHGPDTLGKLTGL